MKVVTQCALASGLLLAGLAHACATPVEVEGCQATAPGAQNCDVLLSPASDFGGPDASVPTGGSGNTGGGGAPPGGNAGSGNPPSGGSAGSGAPPAGGSGGLSGTAGSGSGAGGAAGASNAGSGGAAGAGNAGAGNAGAGNAGAGNAGAGNAGSGSGGTAAQSNFNPAACDFDDVTGCETLGCICAEERCQARCTNIVTCLRDNITCITEDDPLCAARDNGSPNLCTAQVDTGGGINADTSQPSGIVRALVNCVCSDPRP